MFFWYKITAFMLTVVILKLFNITVAETESAGRFATATA
jgi:hypothetical protein